MINFKDRIKKNLQQQQNNQTNAWSKQNTLNKNSSRKDLYRQVANTLSSQQFDSGDFRKNDVTPIQIQKKRNSSIIQMQCQQDIYLNKPIQNYPALLTSNIADNYNCSLFQSKLHETKDQLSQQISDLQKRMKRQIERDRTLIQDYLNRLFNKYTQKSKQQQRKNFDSIVTQLNKNLNVTSKKQKICQSGITQLQQKLTQLNKQFNQFTIQTQQKIQKIINININTDVASSMKKSLSRNMGNVQYIQIKNSIKDMPIVSTILAQQIRAQIHETQQSIKNIKYQLMHLKQDIKTKTILPHLQQQKTKIQTVQITKLAYLQQQINTIKTKLQSSLQSQQQLQTKYRQLHIILLTQQQNNLNLQKSINNNILPRFKKIQQQIQYNTIQKNAQYLKKQVVKQLQSIPIIRIKQLSQEQKQKLSRMKQYRKGQQQVYMLDQYNCIMDCFGNYLLDQGNQRVKLEEEQVYYLEQMEGIQIKMSTLEVK